MTEPKVSIIVPVYNVGEYFERCLSSLTSQTLKEIEIILVDDGSKGETPALCDKAALEDSRIKVIHKENEGAGKARNAGLKIAKGKYIGFVDSDDYVDLKMYEILYEKAEKYSSDFVISGVTYVNGNMFKEDGNTDKRTYFNEDTNIEGKEALTELRLGILGSLPGEKEDSKYGTSVWKNLFKREIIVNNGLYFESEREMLSEDALFLLDYIPCIKKATGIENALYNYVRNEGSISKSYKADRFSKGFVFIEEAEKRLKKDIEYDEYIKYSNRYCQSFLRVICSQEVMYASENNIPYKKLKERLKTVCENPKSESVLKSYPLYKLPLKQALFAYAMKYKLYYLMVKMVVLRAK